MKKSFDFGKIDYNGTGKKINRVTVDVELKYTKNGVTFSASGVIWNSKDTDIFCGGQCLDKIAEFVNDRTFLIVYEMWRKHHLNDSHAGTVEQEAYLELLKTNGWKYNYKEACALLELAGMYEVDGYKYGHAWLFQRIPTNDMTKLFSLFA